MKKIIIGIIIGVAFFLTSCNSEQSRTFNAINVNSGKEIQITISKKHGEFGNENISVNTVYEIKTDEWTANVFLWNKFYKGMWSGHNGYLYQGSVINNNEIESSSWGISTRERPLEDIIKHGVHKKNDYNEISIIYQYKVNTFYLVK